MNASGEKNYKKEGLVIIILSLVLLVIGFSKNSENESATEVQKWNVNSKSYRNRVNDHLTIENNKIEFSRKKADSENDIYAPSFSESRPDYRYPYHSQKNGVDLSTVDSGAQLSAELGRGERPPPMPQNPHDLIQSELFDQDQQVHYSKAYKEEYARQFVENAKRAGYKIILSSDYKVQSVMEIDTSRPDLNKLSSGASH